MKFQSMLDTLYNNLKKIGQAEIDDIAGYAIHVSNIKHKYHAYSTCKLFASYRFDSKIIHFFHVVVVVTSL